MTDTEHLHRLLDAMIERRHVLVLTDLKNVFDEVTRPKGWRTVIREIRRPGSHPDAYGHLEPVVVVEDDVDDPERTSGLSISLRPEHVVIDPWCGCSNPAYCRSVRGVHVDRASVEGS